MSTTRRRPSATADRPRYPEYRDEVGEDPAQWLVRDDLRVIYARIRGLENVELVRAWLDVETDLRGRKKVVAALNVRLVDLRGEA